MSTKPIVPLQQWWRTPTDPEGENSFYVVDIKLHDPSGWKRRVLERCSVLVSNATAAILTKIQASLSLTYDLDDDTTLMAGDLTFSIDANRAKNVEKLLAQVKVDKKAGIPFPFSNAYRFIRCVPDPNAPDRFLVTARLALGTWIKKTIRGTEVRAHKLELIPSTTGLQGLLTTYFVNGLLKDVPRALRGGICQEVAQQVTSYLGQLGSSKVKGDVRFPTIEDRDPARRKAAYEAALDQFATDANPLAYAKARDLNPGDFAANDPKGDRMLVHDPRWEAVMIRPDPHPIPLLCVSGDSVTLLEGAVSFSAGVSKANRHRGQLTPDPRILADRPKGVQRKGVTYARTWHAALPLLDSEDPEIRAALATRKPGSGRGLDFHLKPLPIMGKDATWEHGTDEMLVPIEGNRDRIGELLSRKDVEIAWTRLVRKQTGWHLQLTVRHRIAPPAPRPRIMGVSFNTQAIATWVVLDAKRAIVSQGALTPNPQILAFLESKTELEWDQAKGRWIGGHGFAEILEDVAHSVANQLLSVARAEDAMLAVEDIAYVPKSSASKTANVLFTAWNYGQLRKFLEYKAIPAHLGEVFFASDYITALTCPNCGAIRGAKEAPDKAKTYRDPATGELNCRKCAFRGVLSATDHATQVAKHAWTIVDDRAKAAAKKAAAAQPTNTDDATDAAT